MALDGAQMIQPFGIMNICTKCHYKNVNIVVVEQGMSVSNSITIHLVVVMMAKTGFKLLKLGN